MKKFPVMFIYNPERSLFSDRAGVQAECYEADRKRTNSCYLRLSRTISGYLALSRVKNCAAMGLLHNGFSSFEWEVLTPDNGI